MVLPYFCDMLCIDAYAASIVSVACALQAHARRDEDMQQRLRSDSGGGLVQQP